MRFVFVAVLVAAALVVVRGVDAQPAATTPDAATAPDAAPAVAPDAAPPADAEDTEDLLADIHDDKDDHGGDADKLPDDDEGETFGKQLKIFGVETTWSGYGDTVFVIVPKERKSTFDAIQFNPIFSARITDDFTAEMELELEHGGLETELEYAMVDWTPLHSRALVVRAGKFQIPLGKFNEQFHPSFRWPQVSRPLMFEEVMPVGLSDIGIQVRGLIGRAVQLEYQAWLVNGFAIHEGGGEEEEEEEEEGGFVRGLRDNFIDNNFDKTFGARLGINIHQSGLSATLAASAQTGKIDDPGAVRLTIADVDASLSVAGLTLHVEAAQSFLGRKGHYLDRFERGIYTQLAYTIGRWTLAARWDYTRQVEIEEGAEGEELEHVERQATAGSIRFSPTRQWSVRLEVFVPYRPKGATDETAIAAMVAFVF